MRIGLTGGGATIDKIVDQAVEAETDGFSSIWYASGTLGDPLAPMAVAGRATSRIELGTAVLQTYPCHPLLQANRVASTVATMGRPGFTLGIGPSHEAIVREVYSMSYDTPGTNTEEYTRILAGLLRGEAVTATGTHWSVDSGEYTPSFTHPVPLLLAAVGPRLLRVAGEVADGTVLYLATAKVIATHVAPVITAAAAAAGRPTPRIVAGLPIAVHDDVAQARAAQVAAAAFYARRPLYRHLVDLDGSASAADVAVVGDERSVTAQLQALVDAGVTDIQAAIFPVGDDKRGSIRRTRELLASLCTA